MLSAGDNCSSDFVSFEATKLEICSFTSSANYSFNCGGEYRSLKNEGSLSAEAPERMNAIRTWLVVSDGILFLI